MPSETYRIYDSTNEEWSNETYTLAELSLLPGIKLNSRIIPTQGGNVLTFEDACNSLKGTPKGAMTMDKAQRMAAADAAAIRARGAVKPHTNSEAPDFCMAAADAAAIRGRGPVKPHTNSGAPDFREKRTDKVPAKPRAERSSTTPRGPKPEQASSIPDILLYDQLYTNALIRIVCIYLIFSILASLFISAFCGIAQIINIQLQHELSVGLSLLILFGLLGLILAIIVMYCITQACKKRT